MIRLKNNIRAEALSQKSASKSDRDIVNSPFYNINSGMTGRTVNKGKKVHADGETTIISVNKPLIDKEYVKGMFTKTKYTLNATLICAGIGLGIALYKKKNYFVFPLVGAAVGLLSTNVIMSKYDINEKTD